ncbi:hypothetical protein [Aeromicrobium alkaliterrae]|uniref:DUF1059 domain-containing protein n=1 Tax=Aeromicrobium alkaliterrae TaxID=302168 RepID=A0ABN2K8T1_9ACTN
MAFQLNCPCGTQILSRDDDLLVDVRAHLADAHPGRDYSDNEIRMLAAPVPDRLLGA